jgi:alkanesulfonate monooxygenase SsuD/methylene tetrahydromethanopterin reductase-like flavin-dependent oxidoreductase (luciferase family)
MVVARSRSLDVGYFLPLATCPPEPGRDDLSPLVIGWSEAGAMATRAEDLGFDSFWLSDHFLMTLGDARIGLHECWTFLAGLAGITTRMRLGPLVTSATYRNPALIARMADTVDAMSGGRFVLGIGAGHNPDESHSHGFPYDHRASRFEEAIQIITGLVRHREVTFEGTYYQARDCALLPAGPRSQGVPVMVGAAGPRMIRIAARHADELNIDVGTTLDTIGPLNAAIDDACDEVGRDPATLRRSALIMIDLSSPSLPGQAWGDLLFGRHAYRGTPEMLAGVLRAYSAAGFSEVQVWLNPTSVAGIDAFAAVLALLDDVGGQPGSRFE